MKASFRQSMAWLHTWAGLIPAWIVFVIFLFGTTAYFEQEINAWMRPEVRAAPVSATALDAASQILAERAAGAENWSVRIPGARGGDALVASWIMPGASWRDRQEIRLDPATGRELAVRDTEGGYFLYRFHFDLHAMPVSWARIIVSLAALAMLLAIISGIVTHKKIFADFFMLRFSKGQRSWLDAHNVTAVLALPFHLMITYTGLVTLVFTLMPWAISANFKDFDAYYEAAFPARETIVASGTRAPVLPMSQLVERSGWGVAETSYISIDLPGDAAAHAMFYPVVDAISSSHEKRELNAVTGLPLAPAPHHDGAASATQRVMIALHRGDFAAPALRWLYFLSGVAGTVMIATGMVLWTVKRRAKLPDPSAPHFGFALTERLNLGVIVGAPAGIAAYFLANRLLPLGMAHRADWEINILFAVWGAVLVWGAARRMRAAWIEALGACALLWLAVPVVSAMVTERGLFPSLATDDWVFAGFDLIALCMAFSFALAARKAATHRSHRPARRTGKIAEVLS